MYLLGVRAARDIRDSNRNLNYISIIVSFLLTNQALCETWRNISCFSHYLEISRNYGLLKNHAILKSLHFSSFWAYACVINMPLTQFNLKLDNFHDTFGFY